MPISNRQKDILEAIIEEYAQGAEPVSSKALARQRGFNIGAPMIRKEMNRLELDGFLISPHTSAGRVPTDKAYRMYIQENMSHRSNPSTKLGASKTDRVSGLTPKEVEKVAVSLKKAWPTEQSLLKEVSRLTSEISKELSVAGTVGGADTYIFGFSNLAEAPEFSSLGNLYQLMHFMDNVDRCFDALWSKFLYQDLQVLIGSENPIKEINELALITGRYQLPEGQAGFVSVLGPKRMNYRRNMALVEYMSEVISSL